MGTFLLASTASSYSAMSRSRIRGFARNYVGKRSATFVTTTTSPAGSAKRNHVDRNVQGRLGLVRGPNSCSCISSFKVRPESGWKRTAYSTQLQSFSSTSANGDSDDADSLTGQRATNNNDGNESSQQQNQQQQDQSSPPNENILLDPTSPLSPLLTPQILSTYTLPPTTIGKDDYQTDLPKNQRIVAFGDVHGDITALRRFLIAAKVLDPDSTDFNPRWIGNTTICIQTGDVLDRGDDELACFRLLATLSRQAVEQGGQLLLLYGNHESLNSAGLFHYANPGGNAEFERDIGARIDYNYGSNRWRLQFAGNQPSRWAAMEPGGILAENMLGNMLVSCVVGRTVFVHAGLMGSHLREYRERVYGTEGVENVVGEEVDSHVREEGVEKKGIRYANGISGMNHEAREWISKSHHGPNNNWGEYNTVEEVIAAAQHRAKVASKAMPDCLGGGIGASSPVWMRDYSQPNDAVPKNPRAKDMIVEALKETGPDVQRMVMGHTPQYKINSALGGRAWRIDVGASQGVMGGTPEVLEIIHMGGENDEDIVSILTVDGKRVPAKERETVENVLF